MTGLKHCLKFFLLAAILSGGSTPCVAQSSGGQVVMEEGGKIWRINALGWKIKYYLVASSKNNIGHRFEMTGSMSSERITRSLSLIWMEK